MSVFGISLKLAIEQKGEMFWGEHRNPVIVLPVLYLSTFDLFSGSQLPDKHISVESLDSLAALRDEKHAGSLTLSGSQGPVDQMVKTFFFSLT